MFLYHANKACTSTTTCTTVLSLQVINSLKHNAISENWWKMIIVLKCKLFGIITCVLIDVIYIPLLFLVVLLL